MKPTINPQTLADYKRGWLHFAGLLLAIASFFTMPTGVAFFNGFLGLFGLGHDSNVFMLIPLFGGIFCFTKVKKLWRGYLGERFDGLNRGLYSLPFLLGALMLMSTSIITPSFIDRAYFAVVGRRNDLRAVTVFNHSGRQDMLVAELSCNMLTYSARMMLTNHSRHPQSFQMKLVYEEWGFLSEPIRMQREVFVRDADGGIITFTISPRRHYFVFDDFTVPHRLYPNIDGSGRSTHSFSVVLVNEEGSHSPRFLVRRPILNHEN
jgi:hypothetical protein